MVLPHVPMLQRHAHYFYANCLYKVVEEYRNLYHAITTYFQPLVARYKFWRLIKFITGHFWLSIKNYPQPKLYFFTHFWPCIIFYIRSQLTDKYRFLYLSVTVPSQRTDRRPPGSEPGVPPLYEKGICSFFQTVRNLRTANKTEHACMESRTRTLFSCFSGRRRRDPTCSFHSFDFSLSAFPTLTPDVPLGRDRSEVCYIRQPG